MRFLQSLVVPLLVAGTLAKTQLTVRDTDANNSTDISPSGEGVNSLENVDTSDNLDNVDISDNADNVDNLEAGGVSTSQEFTQMQWLTMSLAR
jgi:hypothetical protein